MLMAEEELRTMGFIFSHLNKKPDPARTSHIPNLSRLIPSYKNSETLLDLDDAVEVVSLGLHDFGTSER